MSEARALGWRLCAFAAAIVVLHWLLAAAVQLFG